MGNHLKMNPTCSYFVGLHTPGVLSFKCSGSSVRACGAGGDSLVHELFLLLSKDRQKGQRITNLHCCSVPFPSLGRTPRPLRPVSKRHCAQLMDAKYIYGTEEHSKYSMLLLFLLIHHVLYSILNKSSPITAEISAFSLK